MRISGIISTAVSLCGDSILNCFSIEGVDTSYDMKSTNNGFSTSSSYKSTAYLNKIASHATDTVSIWKFLNDKKEEEPLWKTRNHNYLLDSFKTKSPPTTFYSFPCPGHPIQLHRKLGISALNSVHFNRSLFQNALS